MVNFNTIDLVYIAMWQSDLENTKESILSVCDKPRKSTALGGAWNFVELHVCIEEMFKLKMLQTM